MAQSLLESKKGKAGLDFDSLLAKDKKNFDVPYGDIEKIKLYKVVLKRRWLGKSTRTRSLTGRLAVKSKKTPEPFRLTTEQYEKLSEALPTILVLKNKIEI